MGKFTKQGMIYGDTFNTHFKNDIAEMSEFGDCNKGANMTVDIMEVDLYIRYPDYYSLPQVPAIKSYAGQLVNKKRDQAIIEFDDHMSIKGRRERKKLYIEKYAHKLKTCFSENVLGFTQFHAVVWLKENPSEGVDGTNFPSDIQIL